MLFACQSGAAFCAITVMSIKAEAVFLRHISTKNTVDICWPKEETVLQ